MQILLSILLAVTNFIGIGGACGDIGLPDLTDAVRQLKRAAGTYRVSGEVYAFGDKGQFSGKTVSRIIEGGYLEQVISRNSGSVSIQTTWWDEAEQSFVYIRVEPSGAVEHGRLTIAAEVWTRNGRRVELNGGNIVTREIMHFSGSGYELTREYSTDEGKNWLPWYHSKGHRIQSGSSRTKSV